MSYWIKINYERSTYVIDLDRISAFSSDPENKRITFWLPNSSQPIILNPQLNTDAYIQVLEYLKKITERHSHQKSWIKIHYDRKEFSIDLNRISTFIYEANGRLTFWLPDSTTTIVIHPNSNAEAYQTIQDYIHHTTGHSVP
ncbi:MAG: hypothetical protein ACRCT1_15955 [Microcoleaceae cyanobacterium]